MLRRRWALIAVVTGLAVSFAIVQFLITPPAFLATTVIQIERRISVPLSDSTDAWLENIWNVEYYPTQYRLLSSRGMAERVVRDLRLYEDPLFNPGYATLPPGEGPGDAVSPEADARVLAGLAGRILGGLTVNPIRLTQLVEIAYRSSSPELAAKVANGVANSYIDWGIVARATTATKASGFLGQQVETLKQEIEDLESRLQAYSRKTDIVSLDPKANVTLKRLEALSEDYVQVVSERINREASYRELTAMTPDQAAVLLDDPLVAQVRSDLSQLEREYGTKLNVYKPEWPAMVELAARIDRAKLNLQEVTVDALGRARETARSEYQTSARREQALEAELDGVKAESRTLSSAAVEYNNLQLEITTKRNLLDQVLRRLSETDVASRLQATRESNVRIVDTALVPGSPYRPSLKRNLASGFGGGLGAGIGLAFLLFFLDRTFKSAEELERQLQLPVLAVIPEVDSGGQAYGRKAGYGYGYGYGHRKRSKGPRRWLDKKKAADNDVAIELLPHARPRLAVAEAYRSLRTALLLSTADELKAITITSTEPSEGKSSTAVNLATVMAQLGRHVALVDGDLRKPRLHEIFMTSNRVGLVSHLTGGFEPEQVILRTEIADLYLVPSGPIPPNPSELLSSAKMHDFVRLLRSRFDTIIIDSPPALAVTDATILAAIADGVVLCVRAGKVNRQDVRACRDRLWMADIKILGAVLNRYLGGKGGYGRRYSDYQNYGAYGESGEVEKPEPAAV